ncbi:MAG: DUF4177 domain-containing protein [Alphaproteobacteria bacterium]|nr:DUF4177 domain-containing protein [Alphaproteobacteria bacterium]
MKEYKAYVYQESLLGSLFLGQSKIDPDKFTKSLNEWALQGWKVIEIVRETRRMLLFWSREAFLVIMERDRRPAPPGAN